MHILYFHQHFTTPRGASGTRSYEMSRALIRHGHTVTMVCGMYSVGHSGLDAPFIKGQRSGVVDSINVIELELSYSNNDNFAKRTLTFLRYSATCIKIALTSKYDLVFSTTTPLTAGAPGIAAKLFRKKPFVFEVRDLWPELPKAMGVIKNPIALGLMGCLEWASYRSADRCVALAPGIAKGIAKRGVSESNIKLIPNGCDIRFFSAYRPAERSEFGLEENDFIAIFSGTHGTANGLESVLDAASELKRRNISDIKFLLIGDGAKKNLLIERANNERLDNVIFRDPIPKTDLASLLPHCDIGIQSLSNVPAFYNGTSPNKFFDYIAAGLPVLNNYPGWLAETIRKHDCGYTPPPGDASAFCDALIDAKNNPSKIKRMGACAKKLAEEHFDRSTLADEWIEWVTTPSTVPTD